MIGLWGTRKPIDQNERETMTQETPDEKTPDELAFVKIAEAAEAGIIAKAYGDMLRVSTGTPEQKFDALLAFAIGSLDRDKNALWTSLGDVGQAAMGQAIDALAGQNEEARRKEMDVWKKIRDRNKPKDEEPDEGGE
jgi:hypothetical protein